MKAPNNLTGAPGEIDFNGVFGQTFRSPAPSHLAANDGADDAVDVANRQTAKNLFLSFNGRLAEFQQDSIVERLLEAVVLWDLAETSNAGWHFGLIKNLAEVEAFGFPVVDGLLTSSRSTRPIILFIWRKPSWAMSSRTSSAMNRMKLETCSGGRRNSFAAPDFASLRRPAGVQVADPHHDASEGDEGRRGETKFFRAKKSGHDHIATGFQLAIWFRR